MWSSEPLPSTTQTREVRPQGWHKHTTRTRPKALIKSLAETSLHQKVGGVFTHNKTAGT
jgi:hypothetical protein